MVELKKIENDDVLEYVGFVAAKYCVPEEAQGDADWKKRGVESILQQFKYFISGIEDTDGYRYQYELYQNSVIPKILQEYDCEVEKFWFLMLFVKINVDTVMTHNYNPIDVLLNDLKTGARQVQITNGEHCIDITDDDNWRRLMIETLTKMKQSDQYSNYHFTERKRIGYQKRNLKRNHAALFLEQIKYFLYNHKEVCYKDIRTKDDGKVSDDWKMFFELLKVVDYAKQELMKGYKDYYSLWNDNLIKVKQTFLEEVKSGAAPVFFFDEDCYKNGKIYTLADDTD